MHFDVALDAGEGDIGDYDEDGDSDRNHDAHDQRITRRARNAKMQANYRPLKIRTLSALTRIPSAKPSRKLWKVDGGSNADSDKIIKPNRLASAFGGSVAVVNMGRILGVNNLNPRVTEILNRLKREGRQQHLPDTDDIELNHDNIVKTDSLVSLQMTEAANQPPSSHEAKKSLVYLSKTVTSKVSSKQHSSDNRYL
eukprot:jgi/Hompol1/1047/HPOL_002636-RA